MSKEHPQSIRMEGIRGRNPNEIICQFIYELTGHRKNRKHASAHLQVWKVFLHERKNRDMRANEDSEMEDSSPSDSDERPIISKQIPNPPPNLASLPRSFPPPIRIPRITDITHSLSLVNHFCRGDCNYYLASNIHFDFGFDRQAFVHFCQTAPAAMVTSMRHVRIPMVEGYMLPLPYWPNLSTLTLDLLPRNPARLDMEDRAWGPQTEELLASLGVTLGIGASITLEMRWAEDCERFEREYVDSGRWRQISATVQFSSHLDRRVDRDKGFVRRCYECRPW